MIDRVRYYFPVCDSNDYQDLFNAIRNRLIRLAGKQDILILVVPLAGTWLGRFVPELDRLARIMFSTPAGSDRLVYIDIDNCMRSQAELAMPNWADKFSGHHDKTGHKIYVARLIDIMRGAISNR